jgi:hypothetical protein
MPRVDRHDYDRAPAVFSGIDVKWAHHSLCMAFGSATDSAERVKLFFAFRIPASVLARGIIALIVSLADLSHWPAMREDFTQPSCGKGRVF